MINTAKVNYGRILFRFENMWVSHPQFKDRIREWWCEFDMEGHKGFHFMKKLQNIKHKLRVWNKNTFSLIKENKDSLWNEMGYLDCKLEEDGCLSPPLKDRKNQISGEMESIIRREDIFWSQKAKCKLLKEGGGNTKYFHKVANDKKRKNIISSLSKVMWSKTLIKLKMRPFDSFLLYTRMIGRPNLVSLTYSQTRLILKWH